MNLYLRVGGASVYGVPGGGVLVKEVADLRQMVEYTKETVTGQGLEENGFNH